MRIDFGLNPKLFTASALLALMSGTAVAQTATDQLWCRAGTLSLLAQDEKKVVMATENRGVVHGGDASDWFYGSTHRCIGSFAVFDGASFGSGFCKQISAQTGDWAVLEWTASGAPGKGAWSFKHGTGKWKGISGGGTYETASQTRPVEAGTYQNCIRVKGTVSIPG